eukprot:m.252461 g.252461  ORF g.252461 m.252461 type:complete len:1091 (+) comp54522_c0_seq2:119-3391(+)
MASPDLLSTLESAAAQLQVAGASAAAVRQAEQVFLEFRKTERPYEICRQILEHSTTPYVQYEAVVTMKNGVLREFSVLEHAQLNDLRDYLLTFLSRHHELARYLRVLILSTIAVIFKLHWTNETLEISARALFFHQFNALISHDDQSVRLVGLQLMSTLLTEIACSSRASDIGLPFDFHSSTKKAFEQTDLLECFSIVLNLLSAQVDQPNPSLHTLAHCIEIAEQILQWQFSSNRPNMRLLGTYEEGTVTIFRPPASWQAVITPNLVNLFASLYDLTRSDENLCSQVSQCLLSLSSATGSELKDETIHPFTAALAQACANILFKQFIDRTSPMASNRDLLCFCSIIHNTIKVYGTQVVAQTDDLSVVLLNIISQLTTFVLQSIPLTVHDTEDTNIFSEMFAVLLEVWGALCTLSEGQGVWREHCHNLIANYIQCRLLRAQQDAKDDTDVREEEGKDYETNNSELSGVALIARYNLDTTLPFLVSLFSSRIEALQSCLTTQNTEGVVALYEELHWLLLVSGAVLTDSTPSHEHALIPHRVMKASFDAHNSGSVDSVVELVNTVLSFAQLETDWMASPLAALLGPQVSATLLWFLARWVRAYLLFSEMHYEEISMNLVDAFGLDTERGVALVECLLHKCAASLALWQSEPDVVDEIINLLLAFAESSVQSRVIAQSATLWKTFEEMNNAHSQLYMLNSDAQRELYRAACRIASGAPTMMETQRVLEQVLRGPLERMTRIAAYDHAKLTDQTVIFEVSVLFQIFRGMARAMDAINCKVIFPFFQNFFATAVALVNVYTEYPQAGLLILEFFSDLAEYAMTILDDASLVVFLQACESVIIAYASVHLAKCRQKQKLDDEHIDHAYLFLRLLTHIASQQFIKFQDSTEDTNQALTSLLIGGFQAVLPIMSAEMFQFPKLALEYYEVLHTITELYTAHVYQSSGEVVEALIFSIDFGLNTPALGPKITRLTLNSLYHLASHHANMVQEAAGLPDMAPVLQHFLSTLFNVLILETFDMDHLTLASNVLLALLCSQLEHFHALAGELVGRQGTAAQQVADCFAILPLNNLALDRKAKTKFEASLSEFLLKIRALIHKK